MYENDPVLIRDLDHLTIIGEQMKAGAEMDDSVETYTKTKSDVERVVRLQGFTAEELDRLAKSKGNRAIILDGMFISVVMTHDAYHEHQWHLSMCRFLGPGKTALVPEKYADMICYAFFSKWKRVPNPGMIKEISHFVGNDSQEI